MTIVIIEHISAPSKMATFDVPTRDSTKSDAVLVNFTNGQLCTDDGIRFGMYESTGKENRVKTLIAETDDLTYVGKTTDMLAPKSAAYGTKHMIAVLDKKTQKVRVYESHMFNLQPQLKAEEEEDDAKPAETYRDRVDLLTSAFGGSKKKRAMESRRKNEILGSKLEGVITKAATEALDNNAHLATPVQEAEPLSEVLPAYNLDATNPLQAFPFHNIISKDVLEACKGPAQPFVDATREDIKKWETEGKYPSYILKYLTRLPIDADSRLKKAACLAYLNHLIFMFKLTFKDLRKKDWLPAEMPHVVKHALTDTFTLKTVTIGRRPTLSMPARMKDKVLSYLLLLCLHLDEFMLECATLLVDLKLSQVRMRNHLQAIGCKVTVDRNTKGLTATLKTPLKFADAPFNRRKR